MNTICGLCGTPLTSMDTLLGENKLADGHVLCNKCLNQATAINRDVESNLSQLFLPEIRGIILEGKLGVSEASPDTPASGNLKSSAASFGFGGPVSRLDEIQDQIVALNARISIFANAEVKELVHVLESDEKLTAVAEGLTMPGKIEGLIFSTQNRIVFIDKKFFGNIQKDEYLFRDIAAVDHSESLLYSTLKISTKSGAVAEFKLHNKSDGRNFSAAMQAYRNDSGSRPVIPQQQQQSQIQASSYNFYNLPASEAAVPRIPPSVPAQPSVNRQKESPESIFEQLEKLGKLREMGILTEEEFAGQKKKLLDRL